MIYLDSASSELLHPKAKKAMLESFENWSNPYGLSQVSKFTKFQLEKSRETLKAIFNVKNNAELIFTSSATESNNSVFNSSKLPILISRFEHPSIFNHPKVEAIIDLNFDVLMKRLSQKPYLVSLSLVNNESGMIVATKDLIRFIKKYGSKVHVDASQAKNVDFSDLDCDFMTISSHKMGGPIGVAAIISKSILNTILFGGGQEFGVRSGTEPVPLIAGFTAAAQELENRYENDVFLNKYLKNSLDPKYFFSNFVPFDFAYHIVCLLTYDHSGTEVQAYMDMHDIVIAHGSACSSGAINNPKILSQFNELPTQNGVRLSFSWSTKTDDIVKFVELWKRFF